VLPVVALLAAACGDEPPSDTLRLSGHVEATEVRVSADVAGRLTALDVDEGSRVTAGQVIARLDTTDTELAIRRAEADRNQADAQLRLLRAGTRLEDVRQAEAQAAAAEGELAAARVEQSSAALDLERFEDLLRRNSGSRKQRDDAAARAGVAGERVRSAEEHVRAAREIVERLKAGARPQELEAARSRVAAADAQLATLQESLRDAVITAPATGVITEKLAEVGELLPRGTAVVLITDLDHAWANVYVDEPMVPRLRLGQPAQVFTDAGGAGLPGTVSYISPRAEFTPRNVQTAEERSKLVYRLKVTVDNRAGILKPGMPVEAQVTLQPAAPAAAPAAS
jgi:HlyD family secretion protein